MRIEVNYGGIVALRGLLSSNGLRSFEEPAI